MSDRNIPTPEQIKRAKQLIMAKYKIYEVIF